MDFRFTEEQRMLRDAAESFLRETSASAAVREAMVTERGFDPALWRRIVTEMGWQAMLVPEAQGGLGLGFVELAAVMEQAGRRLLCAPLFATAALATPALLLAASSPQRDACLARIAAGETATLAAPLPAQGRLELSWREQRGGYLLDGRCRLVPDGHSAALVLVAACSDSGELALFSLPEPSAGLARRRLPTMDQTRALAELEFQQVLLPDSARLQATAVDALLRRVRDLAAIALAAEQVGVAQQALDMSVAYSMERVQFGRAIGSFQSIKHKCADMLLQVEASRSAAYYAACIADQALAGTPEGAELGEAASIAAAYCGEAAFFNAGCGIQLFGGVGFTAEYDVQLYFKRARASESLFGSPDDHRERLAALLLDGERP